MLTPLQFDWDQWNVQKNELKHGVSAQETESVFFDEHHVLFVDQKHSTPKETRYISYGLSLKARVLMIGFTIRKQKIRIITARSASHRERRIYEKNKKEK